MLYDVAVLGGGPAGLATALMLSRAGRTVVVLERAPFAGPRVGESFGPEVRPLLAQLGALDAFEALPQVPFRGVVAAFGSSVLVDRASIVQPLGEGAHVDRPRFDAMLSQRAEQEGATVLAQAGSCVPVREGDGFAVRGASGVEVRARFLVDASGRGAPAGAAALPQRRWLSCDRLVALVGRFAFEGLSALEPQLQLESAPEGWWYAVPQPDGTLLAVLLTDADLLPAGPRDELGARFCAALARTVHTAALVGRGQLMGEPRPVRADSGLLMPDRGEGVRAVGDAAFACDPLAGDGVARALRSGIQAASEIGAALSGAPQPDAAAERVARLETYLDLRARYYQAETRWPSELFWARRRAIDWAQAPLTLDPRTSLRCPAEPSAAATARAECLLPRRAVEAALEAARAPRPAHAVLASLRAAAPLSDRRLLVGLQLLVESGCLAAA